MKLDRMVLGAPGVYPLPDEPLRALTGVRMDVAAFVGVAPRGPSRLPAYHAWWASPPRGYAAPTASLRSVAIPVESWDMYRRVFGGFEGPGLLPYSVAAFFENGGRRAYVVRVVHDYGEGDPENDTATASGEVPGLTAKDGGAFTLRARNEGSWGNRLRAELSFEARPLSVSGSSEVELTLTPDSPAIAGSLLRFHMTDASVELRFVSNVREDWSPESPRRVLKGVLETPLPGLPERIEIVHAELEIREDAGDGMDRSERHQALGLSPPDPRWVAAVLYRDSSLVYPDPSWIGQDLLIDDSSLRVPAPPPQPQFRGGRDRYAALTHPDFFDIEWVPGDDQPRSGVHALLELDDLAIVAVPDLYSPAPLVPAEEEEPIISLAGAVFESCFELPAPPLPDDPGDGSREELEGLRLDPSVSSGLDEIIELQSALVQLAEMERTWNILLDVPPGLNQRGILAWRSRMVSQWAAAYHPWVRVARPDDARDPLVLINPAGFAAGIIARQELVYGVPHGPANALIEGGVLLADLVSPARHDELHQSAINVLLMERDGIKLTAARTLSRDPQWRQLSVRRLVTMVRRTLLRQMQWAAFEPNDPRLRDEVQRMLQTYLRRLYRGNAFRGRTPDEAYFVRCDDTLNSAQDIEAGRLICHVGIAPAEPLEFIVLHLSREGDGTLLMEE